MRVDKNALLTMVLTGMFGLIAVSYMVLSEPCIKTDVVSDIYGEQYYSIGEDIPAGDITVDYRDGYGYLNITENGKNKCYSNLGPEEILEDHMEFNLQEGDTIQVSEGLQVKITYDEGEM